MKLRMLMLLLSALWVVDIGDFQSTGGEQLMLALHNKYRGMAKLNSLIWDDNLRKEAEKEAKTLWNKIDARIDQYLANIRSGKLSKLPVIPFGDIPEHISFFFDATDLSSRPLKSENEEIEAAFKHQYDSSISYFKYSTDKNILKCLGDRAKMDDNDKKKIDFVRNSFYQDFTKIGCFILLKTKIGTSRYIPVCSSEKMNWAKSKELFAKTSFLGICRAENGAWKACDDKLSQQCLSSLGPLAVTTTSMVPKYTTNPNTKLYEFQQRLLDLHNQKRAAAGVLPLTWSSALQKEATNWVIDICSTANYNITKNYMRKPLTGLLNGPPSASTAEKIFEETYAEGFKSYAGDTKTIYGCVKNPQDKNLQRDVNFIKNVFKDTSKSIGCDYTSCGKGVGSIAIGCQYDQSTNSDDQFFNDNNFLNMCKDEPGEWTSCNQKLKQDCENFMPTGANTITVAPAPKTTKTTVAPVPKTTTTTVAPVPKTTTTTAAPVPKTTTTTVAPVPKTTTTTVAPVPKTTTTTVAPVPKTTTTTVAPVPKTTTTTVAPVPKTTTTTYAPVPKTTTTTVAPVPKTTTTTVAPVPKITTTTVAPVPKTTTTTVAPVPKTTTTTVAPVPKTTMTTVAPVPKTTTTTVAPVPKTTTTTVAPVPKTTTTTVAPVPKITTTTVAPVPKTTMTTVAPPLVPPTPPLINSLTSFQQKMLDLHNTKRNLAGVRLLAWDVNMQHTAEQWLPNICNSNLVCTDDTQNWFYSRAYSAPGKTEEEYADIYFSDNYATAKQIFWFADDNTRDVAGCYNRGQRSNQQLMEAVYLMRNIFFKDFSRLGCAIQYCPVEGPVIGCQYETNKTDDQMFSNKNFLEMCEKEPYWKSCDPNLDAACRQAWQNPIAPPRFPIEKTILQLLNEKRQLAGLGTYFWDNNMQRMAQNVLMKGCNRSFYQSNFMMLEYTKSTSQSIGMEDMFRDSFNSQYGRALTTFQFKGEQSSKISGCFSNQQMKNQQIRNSVDFVRNVFYQNYQRTGCAFSKCPPANYQNEIYVFGCMFEQPVSNQQLFLDQNFLRICAVEQNMWQSCDQKLDLKCHFTPTTPCIPGDEACAWDVLQDLRGKLPTTIAVDAPGAPGENEGTSFAVRVNHLFKSFTFSWLVLSLLKQLR